MTRVNDQDLPLIHQSLPEFQRDQIETFVPLDIMYDKCKPNDRQNNTQCVFYIYPFMKSIKSISSTELF